MLALPRCPQILLLLPISVLALLLLQECAAASSVEMHSPTSQVIVLGDSATFNCSVTDIRDYSFRWEYTNDIDDAARFVDHSIRPPVGISITNNTSRPIVFTITFEGRKEFNNIELFCTLWTFGNIIRSDPATLIVIGPPNTPSTLTFPDKHVDMQSEQFLAIWSVPFSHSNHSIFSYNVSVDNINKTETNQRSITVSPGAKSPATENGTLDFPPSTSSCDILIVTLTAINDIGSSEPVSASLFIPTDPDMATSVTTAVLFYSDGTPLVTLEIKFPPLCWFEKLNYSVLLRHDGMESVVVEESVLNPPEYVMHNITAYVKAGTDYSIVVLAGTTVWNTVTDPHNFSTRFHAAGIPVSTAAAESTHLIEPTFEAVSPDSFSSSHKILAAGVGTGIVLIVLILIVLLLLLIVRSRTKRSEYPTCVEDMKTASVPYDLHPNPIYVGDGPLYDIIQDPVASSLSFKPEQFLPPPPATGESMYSESPTLSRKRQEANQSTDHQKELEDCYVQMQACKRP